MQTKKRWKQNWSHYKVLQVSVAAAGPLCRQWNIMWAACVCWLPQLCIFVLWIRPPQSACVDRRARYCWIWWNVCYFVSQLSTLKILARYVDWYFTLSTRKAIQPVWQDLSGPRRWTVFFYRLGNCFEGGFITWSSLFVLINTSFVPHDRRW